MTADEDIFIINDKHFGMQSGALAGKGGFEIVVAKRLDDELIVSEVAAEIEIGI